MAQFTFSLTATSQFQTYPIYTKQGAAGGIFIMDSYKPYNNTLTSYEQKKLKEMYDAAEGEDKKILERILRKYGACKLEL
ncbi:MAG: transcriptional regulator [Lachnospiraceae bacterium]|nr:transcriptional regulator [Lachnospiraceae bacterium]